MCQGINTMNEWYLIKVNHIVHKDKLANPVWLKYHGGIPVDVCIGKEVEYLINQGVITKGCCCGHGKDEPKCLIAEESITLVKELGYEPIYYEATDLWEIKLKGERHASDF